MPPNGTTPRRRRTSDQLREEIGDTAGVRRITAVDGEDRMPSRSELPGNGRHAASAECLGTEGARVVVAAVVVEDHQTGRYGRGSDDGCLYGQQLERSRRIRRD